MPATESPNAEAPEREGEILTEDILEEAAGRLEKVILCDKKRMKLLVEMLDQHPNLSRKEIRKAMDLPPRPVKATAPTPRLKTPTNPLED